jgi:hypothetical protein
MLVREVLVALAAHHPPILTELRRVTIAPLLVDAMDGYKGTADKAARALGLGHRRDLLTREDGPLAVRHDVGDVLALAQLEPEGLGEWAVATTVERVPPEREAAVVGQGRPNTQRRRAHARLPGPGVVCGSR